MIIKNVNACIVGKILFTLFMKHLLHVLYNKACALHCQLNWTNFVCAIVASHC